MFDRMVELTEAGAVPSRKNYFVVSAIVMGVLAITGIVVSIYAEDYSLNASIELAELIAPVEMAQVAPQQPQQPMPRTQQSNSNEVAVRTENVRNIAEISDQVPPISTAPSNVVARPLGVPMRIGNVNSDPGDSSGRGTLTGSQTGLSNSAETAATSQPKAEETDPPRLTKPEVAKIVSRGVINGQATYLPKPAYPPAAYAVAASGKVDVQVSIDEQGRVVSAHAANGNPLLRGAAERAAMAAKFTPTKLSEIPVKVTGIITYNFLRG